jgi:hypothetical protein
MLSDAFYRSPLVGQQNEQSNTDCRAQDRQQGSHREFLEKHDAYSSLCPPGEQAMLGHWSEMTSNAEHRPAPGRNYRAHVCRHEALAARGGSQTTFTN